MTSIRVLITGAGGFVGSALRRAFEGRPEIHVTALGSPKGGWQSGLLGVDLLDIGAVRAIVADARPHVVIHLAAQTSVGSSQAGGFEATWQVNVVGTVHLALALARQAPNACVLFASSTEVYGRSDEATELEEGSPLAPCNAYGLSKAAAERMLAAILPEPNQLLIARPCNHTGPGQGETFALASFAGQIARIEAGLQEPSIRVGNLDVERDFLDVRDVVEAYVRLLDRRTSLPGRFVVNIAPDRASTLRGLLDRLLALSSADIEVVVDPARLRSADLPAIHVNSDLLRKATGWAPKIGTDAMLSDLLASARRRTSALRAMPPSRTAAKAGGA